MTKTDQNGAKADERKAQVSQSDFPSYTLEQATKIAQGLWDDFAGKSAEPYQLALSIGMSPTSGRWRMLCGAAMSYGLTTGSYGAATIGLTELGRKIVSPLEEGDEVAALREASLKPKILGEFFRRYDKAKLPKDEIAKNVLISLGLPKDRADFALEIVKKNGVFCGFVFDTKTGPFVALSGSGETNRGTVKSSRPEEVLGLEDDDVEPDPHEGAGVAEMRVPEKAAARGNRVFLTHGKNKKILEQVKELVAYGKFEPIIAQERETAAKPVPEKVMDDMRSCQAAVIHVGIDELLFDAEGRERPQINGNVLIEIGAAMALYGKNFILLVEEGVDLPSNLQGLYECRYKGDELNMVATMKLLKAFNDFT